MCKLLGDFTTVWDNEEEFCFRRGTNFLCTTIPRQALGCALLPDEEYMEKVKHIIINARISFRATVQTCRKLSYMHQGSRICQKSGSGRQIFGTRLLT